MQTRSTTTRRLPANGSLESSRIDGDVAALAQSWGCRGGTLLPSEAIIAGMLKFNEDLVKAGVLLSGEGLYPSSKGKRVTFGGGKKTVVGKELTPELRAKEENLRKEAARQQSK